MNDPNDRRLPAVSRLLDDPCLAPWMETAGRVRVVAAIREALDAARTAGEAPAPDRQVLLDRVIRRLSSDGPNLRPVINATGILLHTGLGRAPLAAEAVEAIDRIAGGYCNLEFDLQTGERGSRASAVESLLRQLTGAEAATVVNNNAAATVLALRGLAKDREVIVSRGQLIEIGGNFRLPEIFEASGARLKEVGTTNKTRIADYRRAVSPDTAALMRVHPSNYRVVGFTEATPLSELVALGKERGLWVIDDIGSGALDADRVPYCKDEPTVSAGIAAGADLVMFSGDKLLGGPQCGILAGSSRAIASVTADPLARALRVGKLTLAALEATLRLAVDPAVGRRRIPLWSFLNVPIDALKQRAERLAELCRREFGWPAEVVESAAYLGGGSAPSASLASFAVRLDPLASMGLSEGMFADRLRRGEPSLATQTRAGAVWIDLRAVAASEDELIALALRRQYDAARS